MENPTQDDNDAPGEDLIPYWVAFNVAGVLLVIGIILYFLKRNDKASNSRVSSSELVWIIFLNMLILGGVQENFELTSMAILIPVSIYFLAFLLEMTILLAPSFRTIAETISDCITTKRPALIDKLSHEYKKSPLLEDLVDWFSRFLNVESNIFLATEKLEDLSAEFFRNMLIGGAQIALLAAYMVGVYQKGSPDFSEPITYLYYYLGVFVQSCYVVGKGVIHRSFLSILFWCKVSLATNDGEVLEDEKGKRIVLKDKRFSIILRSFVSAAVNGMGLFWTILLLPLQLASSEDFTDFVLNAIAVFFIVELDDLDPEKIFRFAYSYLPITKKPIIRLRVSLQVMDKEIPDPGYRFVPTKDAAMYLTFSTGSVSPVLKLLQVSILQKNREENNNNNNYYAPITEETRVRLPLQLLGPSGDMKNRDPRRRFDATESAALLVTTAPDTDPRFSLHKMNVDNPSGIRSKIKNRIRNALEVLPFKPYEPVSDGQRIRLLAELMESARDDPNPAESYFEPTKGIALYFDTETNNFSLLQREDQLQQQ